MEHRLQKIKLASCVTVPTYTLHGFVVLLSCKSEVTLLFPYTFGSLVSLIGKPKAGACSCHLVFFVFSKPTFVQPKAFERLVLET